MALTYTVEFVSAAIISCKTGALVIHADGTVTSGGWSQLRLSPYIYIAPPADGIWDFSLEGTPPSDNATTVITPVAASAIIPNPPVWLRGVRIHASANRMEALLGASQAPTGGSGLNLLSEGDLPWPDVLRTDVNGGAIIGNG